MGEASLLSALAGLGEAAAGEVTAEQLLVGLADAAALHLDVDAVGVMVNSGPMLHFAHASHTGIVDVERLQHLMQEGPGYDAALFEVMVVVDDLRDPVQTAWPEYVSRTLEAGYTSLVAVPMVNRGRTWGSLDLYRRHRGGWDAEELEWARVLAHVAVSYVAIAVDRDESRRAQQQLAHASTHDALTGLPNRVLLFDRLEHALHTARRTGRVVAVFFIDLDRFKAVNDTYGHAAGDLVLSTVAARMKSTLRQEDTLARLSGDEFVLVCADLPGGVPGDGPPDEPVSPRTHVEAVLDRLHRVLAPPIRVAGTDLVVSATIGVGLGGDRSNADDLLAEADREMYDRKQRASTESVGPGRGALVGSVRRQQRRERRTLERQLSQALSRGELLLHYQPITDVDGRTCAVEALLRWEHPQLGLLPAAEFIDLATGTGLVVDIGRWVIEQTCAQMAAWRDDLGAEAPRTAYVNVSTRELVDPRLTATIAAALERHGLQPAQLGLELLESSFIDPEVLPTLQEQSRRGHPLSVDDFGTGYSSLSRLVELPVQMAKIDKSFIARIDVEPRRRALVDAVVTIARSLDLRVVAEGVETVAQARAVADAGCDYLQGFLYGPPRPGADLGLDLSA